MFGRVVGRDNMHTLSCLHDIGKWYFRRGEYDMAVVIFQDVADRAKNSLGDDDTVTLAFCESLEMCRKAMRGCYY
jgi:hypothetical protein